MLSLSDKDWFTLTHAYGVASDIPALLHQLGAFPPEDNYRSEPWFSFWSALCHQGDVYSASFAAVPHIVEVMALDPARATISFFLLPAEIELARIDRGVSVPEQLAVAYQAALTRIPPLAARVAERSWTPEFGCAVLAAVAIAKGQVATARLLTRIDSDDAEEVLEWYLSR